MLRVDDVLRHSARVLGLASTEDFRMTWFIHFTGVNDRSCLDRLFEFMTVVLGEATALMFHI